MVRLCHSDVAWICQDNSLCLDNVEFQMDPLVMAHLALHEPYLGMASDHLCWYNDLQSEPMSNADEFVLCSASGYDLCSNLHNLRSRSTAAFDLVLPSPQTSISSATHNMPSRPLSVWSCRRWNSPVVDLMPNGIRSQRKRTTGVLKGVARFVSWHRPVPNARIQSTQLTPNKLRLSWDATTQHLVGSG